MYVSKVEGGSGQDACESKAFQRASYFGVKVVRRSWSSFCNRLSMTELIGRSGRVFFGLTRVMVVLIRGLSRPQHSTTDPR